MGWRVCGVCAAVSDSLHANAGGAVAVGVSGALNTVAASLMKIANDAR